MTKQNKYGNLNYLGERLPKSTNLIEQIFWLIIEYVVGELQVTTYNFL